TTLHLYHSFLSYSCFTVPSHALCLPFFFFFSIIPPPPRSTLFPYTTLFRSLSVVVENAVAPPPPPVVRSVPQKGTPPLVTLRTRSEEHTSELQSPYDLVCRLLLEKKKKKK